MVMQHKLSHSWWFQSKNRAEVTNQSPWLTLTLSELEDKTNQMLELIEDDSDSFARRAEMYYKKRPQLVNMIEEFFRTHRSLAEQYDQLKSGVVRRSTSFSVRSCSFSTSNSETDEPPKLSLDSRYSDESEVDDPEHEEDELEDVSKLVAVADKKTDDTHIEKLEQEIKRLNEENAALKSELEQKDESKREVIKQLAMSLDILKDENVTLRKCIKDSKKKSGDVFGFKKLTKDVLSGKIFGGPWKSQTTIVAL